MFKHWKNNHHKSKDKNEKESVRQKGPPTNSKCQSEWFLVQRTGTAAFRLNPLSVIILGSEQCDINIQSPSVEKRHAVLCFDPNSECFSVKDLNSTNGTFLNNRRISSDRPEKLNNMDLLRFGYDSNLYEIRLGSAAGLEAPPQPVSQNGQNLNLPYSTPSSDPVVGVDRERFSQGMQQSGGRGNSLYGSRVSSPSLTLDSGRGSSSAPSSPAKEMSPVPVSNSASSNLLYSPNLSRKINHIKNLDQTQVAPGDGTDSRLLYSSHSQSGQNSQEQLASLRRDSLEDEIDNVIDNIVFPNSNSCNSAKKNKDFSKGKSAIFSDHLEFEHDLKVPNEVFDEQFEPKEQSSTRTMVSSSSNTNSNVVRHEGIPSRPRSLSGGSLALSVGNAPGTPIANEPTPLYGTPHWWPQQDEEFSPTKDHDDCQEPNSDYRPQYHEVMLPEDMDLDPQPESFNSESNLSLGSTTSSVDKKKISPMAFTVDFDDGPKKFGIADSISKFAPKHRRNISLSKADDLLSSSFGRKKDTVNSIKELASSSLTGLPSPGSGTSSTANNKSVIQRLESDLNLKQTGNVSKSSRSAKLAKSDNNKIGETETTAGASVSSKKSANELFNNSKLRKPQPMTSLFSSRLRPRKYNEELEDDKTSNQEITNPNAMKLTSKLNSKSAYSKDNKSVENSNTKSKSKIESGDTTTDNVDKEDTSSETGTYTVEKDNVEPAVEKARKDIAKMLGVSVDEKTSDDSELSASGKKEAEPDQDRTIGSGAPEWVREWAEQAAMQHKKDLTPVTDTQLFLQETENLVSQMQERVTRNLSNHNSSHNSDSDDEATLSHNSPPKVMSRFKRPISARVNSSPLPREASVLSDSGYQIGYQSDSSNEGLREYRNIGAVKINKAFNVRRGRIGYESDGCANAALNRQSLLAPVRGISPRPVGSNGSPSVPSSNASFSRNDGGRFSLRMPKSKPPTNQMPSPMPPPRSTPVPSPKIGNSGNQHASTNRRQSYTTPSASSQNSNTSINFRKPPSGSRSNSTLTAKEVELANWKRRKGYDPMRAAAEGRKKQGTSSAVETTADDITPISLSKQSSALMSKSMSFHMENNFSSKCHSEEEDMIYVVDEVDSSHSNSPIHIPMSRASNEENYYGMSHSSLRPKNKLEALDNLVIATIHSLSNKVRTSSRNLLEKLQIQHVDDENGALLEEMVSQLKELELSSSASSPNKSPSRELSGTLKNLKKMEQVILVLDRVLCDDSGSDANN